jgi:hypothetical protein
MKLKKLHKINELNTENIKEVNNINISNRIILIEHKEKPILYLDYSNFQTTDETIKTIIEVNDYVKKLGDNEILLLVDVRKSYANEKIVVDALKQNAIAIKPFVKKAAVVGVTFKQEVILTAVNMFSSLGIKPFDTVEAAKEWLIC